MSLNPGFLPILAADPDSRRGLFAATAQRLGTSERNVEKDFWVCLTLDVLFNGLPPGGPRLLFKGGTSLSKAYGLINRFSEDIDVTVFRGDLGHPATVEALEAMSGKKRKVFLEEIQVACRRFIPATCAPNSARPSPPWPGKGLRRRSRSTAKTQAARPCWFTIRA